MVPTRHALAALTLEYGVQNNDKQYIEEAENIYRTDLGKGIARAVAHPNNIWSLIGLNLCLKH